MVPEGSQTVHLVKDTRNTAKINQILPTAPLNQHLNLASKQVLIRRSLSFSEAFGVLGIPMLFILVVCIVWTAWLVFVELSPNTTANLLMNTGVYGNGQFWLIDDANPKMTLAGAIGLMIVGVYYTAVALRILFWRNKLFESAFRKCSRPNTQLTSCVCSITPSYNRIRVVWSELTSFEGENRKNWVRTLLKYSLVLATFLTGVFRMRS